MIIDRSVINWLAIGCFLIFAMVVIGGITRLTQSGLSMVEWKLISGTIPPTSDAEWQEAFEKYKAFPEFKHVNFHFDIEDFKSIFWWEYIHRLLGRVLGLVFIIPYLYFLWKKKINPELNKKLLVILGLGAFQGFLGWFMVKSGLVDHPDVSHYRLAMHLITAFLTFAYTFWVILELKYPKYDCDCLDSSGNTRMAYTVFFGLLLIQIIYGAFVAGLDAGKIYNTYPKMGDQWVADSVWQGGIIEGVAGVQFVHRTLAVVLVVFYLILLYLGIKNRSPKRRLNSLKVMGVALLFQFILGVLTLIYAVPITLGVLHQLGAFILLSSAVYTVFQHRRLSNTEVIPSS